MRLTVLILMLTVACAHSVGGGAPLSTPDGGGSMTELEDLSARVHVRELLDRYHAGINTRDFDLLATLFTGDAVWEVGPEPAIHVRGRDAIMAKLHETVGRQELLVQANFAMMIDVVDRDHARAHSTIIELGRAASGGMQVIAAYDDELVRVGGRWRYARHKMTVKLANDASVPGKLYPPATEDTAGNKAFVLEMIGQKKQLSDYPDRVSDAIVVHEPSSLPFGGTYRGIKAFEQFYPRVRAFYDFTHFELQHVYADGDKVFAISKAAIAHTSDSILLCEEMTFSHGKVVEVRLYFYDSRPVHRSIADAARAAG